MDQYTADSVSSALRALYVQHYSQLIAFTIAFFDHALTFEREVELIWKKRWSKSKILYFLCRYMGNILVIWDTIVYFNKSPSHTFCIWGLRIAAYLAVICTLVTQLIMRFRIQALYGNHYLLSRALLGVLIGETVSLATIGLVSTQQLEVTTELLPGIYHCTQIKFPSWSWLFWLPILLFDTLLFGLAIGGAVQNWRELAQEKLTKLQLGSSLTTVLLRDSFGYFFCAFGMYLTTTVVWITAETTYFGVPATLSFSITTVLGSRLILNLCNAYHNPLSCSSQVDSEWDTRLRWEPNWVTGIEFVPFEEPTSSRERIESVKSGQQNDQT